MPGPLDRLLASFLHPAPEAPPYEIDEAERTRRATAAQGQLPSWKQRLIGMLDTAGDAVGDFAGGLMNDPTQPIPETDRNPAYAGGAVLAAGGPFGPKGIKGMYSRVERIAESLPSQINPGKLLSILKNRTSGEELAWRKVPEFVGQFDQARPVPKAGLVDHLQTNPLDVRVIEKSDLPAIARQGDTTPEAIAWYDQHSPGEFTQYSNYQMPGASNYREDLIQLDRPGAKGIMQHADDGLGATFDAKDVPDFLGHHWDEPNVLAHVRHNERNLPPTPETPTWLKSIKPDTLTEGTAPGKGPLGRMLENVQSDWHQRGAHAGYANDPSITPTSTAMAADVAHNQLDELTRDVESRLSHYFDQADLDALDPTDVPEYMVNRLRQNVREGGRVDSYAMDAADRLQAARVAYDNALDATQRGGGAVPDAPFKDNWAELALKQQLLDIAHNRPDLEWLGIAPSEVLRRRGEVISPEFQDVQLPRTLEKILAPFGGKLERAPINIPANATGQTGGPGDIAGEVTIWLAKLPPEIKDAILKKGMPLMSLYGLMQSMSAPPQP